MVNVGFLFRSWLTARIRRSGRVLGSRANRPPKKLTISKPHCKPPAFNEYSYCVTLAADFFSTSGSPSFRFSPLRGWIAEGRSALDAASNCALINLKREASSLVFVFMFRCMLGDDVEAVGCVAVVFWLPPSFTLCLTCRYCW